MFWESSHQNEDFEPATTTLTQRRLSFSSVESDASTSFEHKDDDMFAAAEDVTLYDGGIALLQSPTPAPLAAQSPSMMSSPGAMSICENDSTDIGSLIGESPPARTPTSGNQRQRRRLFFGGLSELSTDSISRDSGCVMSAASIGESPTARSLSFGSLGSMEEDNSLDLSDLVEPAAKENQFPGGFSNLISGSLIAAKCDAMSTTPVRLQQQQQLQQRRPLQALNSNARRARSCLFSKQSPTAGSKSFKRPEPPTPVAGGKKQKLSSPSASAPGLLRVPAVPLMRLATAPALTGGDAEQIKTALHRSSTERDLIGDFSSPFCLPTIAGEHSDLKSISAATLADLIHGQYRDAVASFRIVDCRYPYEYEGGHVYGADNQYTKDEVVQHLLNPKITASASTSTAAGAGRHIVVFHCEFSKERGPNLSRYLRSVDRSCNVDSYPRLHYPEVYLLAGGYRSFYGQYPELCTPMSYRPMLHPDHAESFRHFRAKSQTWNCDSRTKSVKRCNSLRRLY